MIKKFEEFVTVLTESNTSNEEISKNKKYLKDVIKKCLNFIEGKETSVEFYYHRGLIVCGTPGIGKDKFVKDVIKEVGGDEKKYVFIEGENVENLPKTLKENNNKLIVINGIDVFKNKENVSCLKHAMDRHEKMREIRLDNDTTFTFNGFVVIIINQLGSFFNENPTKEYANEITQRCIIVNL